MGFDLGMEALSRSLGWGIWSAGVNFPRAALDAVIGPKGSRPAHRGLRLIEGTAGLYAWMQMVGRAGASPASGQRCSEHAPRRIEEGTFLSALGGKGPSSRSRLDVHHEQNVGFAISILPIMKPLLQFGQAAIFPG